MRLKAPPLKIRLLLLALLVPLVAWFVVKPLRVVAPQLVGVSCISATVCVDDIGQSAAASQLYSEALGFVSREVAPVAGAPKVIFCFTQSCADSFGLGLRSAVTLATFGTVIGPRAWKPYYVRHELIHYLQAERLGALHLLLKPQWFVEGMAYGLSLDPRQPLAEPFETFRKTFLQWNEAVPRDRFWLAAESL